MKRYLQVFSALLLLSLSTGSWGCAARMRVRAAAPAADSLAALRADLSHFFADPNFADAQWGVEVVSLDRSELIYEQNSTRLYMPASNNKLLTTAAALVRLGPDFHYDTRVMADGPVQDGTLQGNLIVVGSGDPSIAPRFQGGDPFRTFREWAGRLKGSGISAIAGDLLGDESAFEGTMLGSAWEWDDLAYGYAAPISALQFNENLLTVTIAPGAAEGAAAILEIKPLDRYLTVDNRVVTAAAGSEAGVEVERGAGRESIVLKGTIPLKNAPLTQNVSVRFPADYYLEALKLVLGREGIDVSHCSIKAVRGWNPPSLRLLWLHSSPSLAEIIRPLLKVSQNLYAETLVRTLGLRFHDEGSFARGKDVVEAALRGMSIGKGTYYYADGSGLSRRNLITADLLVRIFQYMYRSPYFLKFYDSLPIAGVDGTISARMKGTPAENNVHAKTGTIANVRSLSGYLRTADGEMLAFSMLANNFLVNSKMAEYVQDCACARLAAFSRK